MRCGTTSLFELLREHPEVFMPESKELHYFDRRNPDLPDQQTYGLLFDAAKPDQRCGEVTPDYLSTHGCDAAIHALIPGVRLIAVLRDPVERAWSHYQFSRFHKVETEPLAVALSAEEDRLAMATDHSDIFFSYQQRGRYIEHIRRYAELFPRRQIHVVLLDDLVHDTRHAVEGIMSFLGVDFEHASLIGKFPSANRTSAYQALSRARAATGMFGRLKSALRGRGEELSREDRATLTRYFEPYNHALEDWLGRPLPW